MGSSRGTPSTDWNKIGAIAQILGVAAAVAIGVATLLYMWWLDNRSFPMPVAWWMPTLISLTLIVVGLLFYKGSVAGRHSPQAPAPPPDDTAARELYSLMSSYVEITFRFPDSPAVRNPFVTHWRPSIGEAHFGEDVRLMMEWGKAVGNFLERHKGLPTVRNSTLYGIYRAHGGNPFQWGTIRLLLELYGELAGY